MSRPFDFMDPYFCENRGFSNNLRHRKGFSEQVPIGEVDLMLARAALLFAGRDFSYR